MKTEHCLTIYVYFFTLCESFSCSFNRNKVIVFLTHFCNWKFLAQCRLFNANQKVFIVKVPFNILNMVFISNYIESVTINVVLFILKFSLGEFIPLFIPISFILQNIKQFNLLWYSFKNEKVSQEHWYFSNIYDFTF